MAIIEPEKITGGGVLLTFPAATSSSLQKELPQRLKQRLVVQPKTPLSDEYVHNKLKEADLRRQKFYELLVSKAKPKVKKASTACLNQENLARRLQAKLIAAEQKRIKILGDAQMRLSNQNELRQACKHGRELQAEKQREELGMKVIYRIQQAETNRMILLEACTQRIAAKRERAAESLSQKMSRDRKYRECKSASIYKKRADAERRRRGLLEAEKKRARAMILKVRQAAWSRCNELETKRKMMKDKLEDRLQRAKKQRVEYLRRRRRNLKTHQSSKSKMMNEQREYLSRKLAWCWRRFVKLRKTTFSLAKASFVGCLEFRLMISQAVIGSMCNRANIDHLLRHIAFPTYRDSLGKVSGRGPVKLSRYPVRVLLCAYMIIVHPDIVFSGQSECETTLAESAANFIREFELLIKIIINGPILCTVGLSGHSWKILIELGGSYLHHFVDWKSEDAKLLKRDLVRAAWQLELELSTAGSGNASKDKVKYLTYHSYCAYHITHHKFKDQHVLRLLQTFKQIEKSYTSDTSPKQTQNTFIVCSFFSLDIDGSFLVKGADSLPSRNAIGVTDRGLSLNLMFSENELLVNKIIHEHQSRFADGLDVSHEDHDSLKVRVRETIEKAFWDGVLESMKNDEPDFSWVLKRMKEVRDELYEMSPQPWRKEISETIDVDILEQMLKSGAIDIAYLRSILEFTLITLRKLSAPANDEAMTVLHNKILRELGEVPLPGDESKAPYVLSIIKGLRFTLQEIQTLKREISRARIKLLEPVIRGPIGLEYLIMAFANGYGPPSAAPSSLSLTKQWLSSVSPDVEQEWHEHMDYLRDFTMILLKIYFHLLFGPGVQSIQCQKLDPRLLMQVAYFLRDQPECPKEPIGLLVRLGLLKLVNRVEDLTMEDLPETLKLNVFRLRTVKLQIQKIIVIFISMLVFHQSLMVKNWATNSADVEYIVSQCFEQLCKLLDGVEEVGLSDIIEKINGTLKVQDSRTILANMLAKSLQAGDVVYTHVSHSIYLTLRGVTLVEAALRGAGAAVLVDRVIKVAEVLIVIASISLSVHQEWYKVMLENL
ncbi:hypothetical protein K2173_007143 [Erythroxylum novogranatense]|uniref:T-complex protein 11 n=1 Tax=Erythroxylum novogranatense TaxID=1862640 RepID=A0AAV8SZF0_9ROSI|nr:hypothetical protein K2173_007143 [Erythroxylum novogranatense]